MPTSFIKSTMDRFQSSFSGFLLASASRMAATSTTTGAEEGTMTGAGAGAVADSGAAGARADGCGETTATVAAMGVAKDFGH